MDGWDRTGAVSPDRAAEDPVQRHERQVLRQRVVEVLVSPDTLLADVYTIDDSTALPFDRRRRRDLLVVVDNAERLTEAERRFASLPVDALVLTAEQWDQRQADGLPFYQRLAQQRVLLVDRERVASLGRPGASGRD